MSEERNPITAAMANSGGPAQPDPITEAYNPSPPDPVRAWEENPIIRAMSPNDPLYPPNLTNPILSASGPRQDLPDASSDVVRAMNGNG